MVLFWQKQRRGCVSTKRETSLQLSLRNYIIAVFFHFYFFFKTPINDYFCLVSGTEHFPNFVIGRSFLDKYIWRSIRNIHHKFFSSNFCQTISVKPVSGNLIVLFVKNGSVSEDLIKIQWYLNF